MPNSQAEAALPGDTAVRSYILTQADVALHGQAHAVPVRAGPPGSGWVAEALYRCLEIVLATAGLIAGAPLVLIAAVLVRLDSPGPALFFQRRPAQSAALPGRDLVGRSDLRPPPDGYDPDALYYVPRYFTLIKLRSMHYDATCRYPDLYAYDFTPENFHRQYSTLKEDPRVTRVGRIIRTLSVDELLNLWSVLVGDMRLVGPRPEAPGVLRFYTPEEMYKFQCKPGITGLAQVNGRGLLNWGETIAFDLEYVRTRNVLLDLKIIGLTVLRVLGRHGAF